jgi:hypothetical protein
MNLDLLFEICLWLPTGLLCVYTLFHLYHFIIWRLELHDNPDAPAPFNAQSAGELFAIVLPTIACATFAVLLVFFVLPSFSWIFLQWVVCLALVALLSYTLRFIHKHYRLLPKTNARPEPPQPGEISETAKKIIDELSKRP